MIYYALQNANSSVIAVTGTATLLKSLLDTAGSVTHVFPDSLNGVDLYVEDGDIRVLFDDQTPTASKGILLKKGVYYHFRHVDLFKMRLIRTGSSNVAVGVQIGFSSPEEITTSSNVAFASELQAGEDLTNDVIKVEQRFSYNYISTATTTQVKSGAGFLHAIVVGETAAGSIKVIDNTSGTTTNLGELKASIVEGTYVFNCSFATGLRIVTAAASKITVIYR
ncbi:MAG: hypothetical protein AB1757_06805 [Acidobacteriota bacterium]